MIFRLYFLGCNGLYLFVTIVFCSLTYNTFSLLLFIQNESTATQGESTNPP